MSKVQMLRVCVEQRLSAAAEEILVLFERMISEYEEELCRSKEENERHRKLLDAVFKPQLQIHRAERSADVQQLLESKEEVPPEQQERSSSLDQEEPEPPHIKEEQEELWTSQEGEQLQGLEEADITTFTPVSVKSEDDEEKPQSSQLHHRQTEAGGGSEPASNVDPDSHLKPVTHVKPLESEADNRDDWKEISELQAGVNSLGSDDESDMQCNTDKESFSCSECGRTFCRRDHLMSHMRTHTGEKPYSCNMAVRRKYDVNFKERVLQYAEENSGKKTAQHFDIDPKRIRYWQKQKSELLLADKQRARLTGGGRKKVSAELERLLLEWIYTMREKNIRVTTKMIKNKALEIYPSVSDAGQVFVASRSWLQRFLQRNNLSLRCTASLPRPPLL